MIIMIHLNMKTKKIGKLSLEEEKNLIKKTRSKFTAIIFNHSSWGREGGREGKKNITPRPCNIEAPPLPSTPSLRPLSHPPPPPPPSCSPLNIDY